MLRRFALLCIFCFLGLTVSCFQSPKFEGKYTFFVCQKYVGDNPYIQIDKNKLFSYVEKKAIVVKLAPVELSLQKIKNEYKGQVSVLRYQKQTFTGMQDDTSSFGFELKNILTSGDTLNFLMQIDLSVMGGNRSYKGFFVKGKENIIALQDEFVETPICFETCPSFIGKNKGMLLFKELNISLESATAKMLPPYRTCLLDNAEKADNKYIKNDIMKSIMYIDSVMLQK